MPPLLGRWGVMLLWAADGVLETVEGFRCVKGCADLPPAGDGPSCARQRLGIEGSVANVS